MTSFIIHHPIASLLIVAFVSALIALFVGGLCKSAAMHDESVSVIEPGDLSDPVCSWCQREQAIKAQPHESHGICKRHFDEMMADAKRISNG
jgi:hypothetical protein